MSVQSRRSKALELVRVQLRAPSRVVQLADAHPTEVPNHMKDACRYAERPFSLLARYIMVRPVAHAAIVMAVLGAVGCSVAPSTGSESLKDGTDIDRAVRAGGVF